ncbi:MAG: 2,3-bisphosphoglycerate-independent phosphoglycerate mutase [Candidatus Nitrospinota bacterium M3_3B_026]
MEKRLLLLILDGWGISDKKEWNAIEKGDTPVLDRLNKENPYTLVHASEEEVGLPAGQMGNSEVGHLNIGAGRVVYQDFLRITKAIEDGAIYDNEKLKGAAMRAAEKNSALHFLGLLSDGGVHSHIGHLEALLDLAKSVGASKVFVHAFMDGRDTSPTAGVKYIKRLEGHMSRAGVGAIATVQGRFYAMDRDRRWDRVEKAYNLMVRGEGHRFESAVEAVRSGYEHGVTDEFIEPSVIVDGDGEPKGLIGDGDEVIMFNFRADRMRQIVHALYDPSFHEFRRDPRPEVNVTCLTEYDATFGLPAAFEPAAPKRGLGQVLSENNVPQLRTAETEKYAHVTFFFNGGVEKPFQGESRKLIASPHVRTYDLKPEMSCPEVTDTIIAALKSGEYGVIIANLANGDMVGHTGVWEAALKAVNVVDQSVGRVIKACEETGVELLITADHGNIETMKVDGEPMTAHTTNPVPFYYIGPGSYKKREGGRLADIAPTMLKLLGLPKPDDMTGEPLLV